MNDTQRRSELAQYWHNFCAHDANDSLQFRFIYQQGEDAAAHLHLFLYTPLSEADTASKLTQLATSS